MSSKTVKVLDCTIRDGGYLNEWYFTREEVRESFRAASHAGVDYVEIGFRGSTANFDPKRFGTWRFTSDADIRDVTAGIAGTRIAVMGDFGKIAASEFANPNESPVSLVRVATNKRDLPAAVELLQDIKAKGDEVALNAMGAGGYTVADAERLAMLVAGSGIDYVYLADSYGSLFPHQVPQLFAPLLAVPDIETGFHPHNNLQMAFANTMAAIEAGVHIVDSTMFGMGRGAGNLPTEILLAYLEQIRPERFNAIPVLNCIDLYFLRYQQSHPWGYQLHYMLSGMMGCHPNFAKDLIDRRRFTMDEIWRGLEFIRQRGVTGYSATFVDELVATGVLTGRQPVSSTTAAPAPAPTRAPERRASYQQRHAGRPILVLGNGPSLVKQKPQIERLIELHEPIVIGANYLGGHFVPDYHAFTSPKRFRKYAANVDPQSKLLLSEHFDESFVRQYTDRPFERLRFDDILDAPFAIDEHGVIGTNCRTVSILLMGVAIVMGAQQVLAAGLDGYLGKHDGEPLLFYEEEDEVRDPRLLVETHHWCERHLEQIDAYLHGMNMDGIHIVTPTAYKRFFKGVENFVPVG